ncbi:MAG: SDR family NAD(P)-dependent oxidoreductase, partial [Pseudomonadota bacterium]
MTGGLFDLSGRVVCVTGASSGIGRALAAAFAEAGARVVGVARRAAHLADWKMDVERSGGRAAACVADVGDLAALPSVAMRIAEPFGTPDILVN